MWQAERLAFRGAGNVNVPLATAAWAETLARRAMTMFSKLQRTRGQGRLMPVVEPFKSLLRAGFTGFW